MEKLTSPTITSFVLRFVHDAKPGSTKRANPLSPPYRGTILHVQSNEELAFTRWGDIVDFIQRYVPLDVED